MESADVNKSSGLDNDLRRLREMQSRFRNELIEEARALVCRHLRAARELEASRKKHLALKLNNELTSLGFLLLCPRSETAGTLVVIDTENKSRFAIAPAGCLDASNWENILTVDNDIRIAQFGRTHPATRGLGC